MEQVSLFFLCQGLLREHIEELRHAVAKEQKGSWASNDDGFKGRSIYKSTNIVAGLHVFFGMMC